MEVVSRMTGSVAREADLPPAAGAMVGRAEGWWTVAYTVPVMRSRRVSEGVDDDGRPIRRMVQVEESSVVVLGLRGGRRFLAAWAGGRADCAYWWTREHEAWADLPRERVTWTTPTPTPVRVPFAELRRLIAAAVELPVDPLG